MRKPPARTIDEARTFLESARADGDPLYALYVLVLVLGLHKGEALGLDHDVHRRVAMEILGTLTSP